MNSSVLAYLENSAEYFPEKCAVTDEKVSYSYSELVKLSSSVGTALSELIVSGDAVGIYMEKCADAVAAFFATVYAGGFYSVLNTELPQNRLQTTVSVLNPKVIVTSESLLETAKEYFSERKIVTFEDLAKSEPDYAKLGEIRSHKIDTDPLYINFTSGSTGTPKGIVVCHRSVIDFIDHFTEIFGIDNNDVIEIKHRLILMCPSRISIQLLKQAQLLLLCRGECSPLLPNSLISYVTAGLLL